VIDWNALVVGPVMGVFAQPVTYVPAGGAPISITAVFDEAFQEVTLPGDASVLSTGPMLGVQLSQMPAGFDPEASQGDQFTVLATGATYVVRQGQPDGHGWALLLANEA
jgi:hypothetical protein